MFIDLSLPFLGRSLPFLGLALPFLGLPLPLPCVFLDLSLPLLWPFTAFTLPLHCLSLAFYCLHTAVSSLPFLGLLLPLHCRFFTAFPWPFKTFVLPFLGLSLPSLGLYTAFTPPLHRLSGTTGRWRRSSGRWAAPGWRRWASAIKEMARRQIKTGVARLFGAPWSMSRGTKEMARRQIRHGLLVSLVPAWHPWRWRASCDTTYRQNTSSPFSFSLSLSLSLSFLTFFFSSFLFFFFSLLLLLLHHHSGRTSARTLRTLCPTGGDRDAQRAVLPAGGGSQRIFKQTHEPTHRTIKDALRSSGRRDGRAPAAEGPPEHRTRTGDSPRHPELQPSFCFGPARRKHPLRC